MRRYSAVAPEARAAFAHFARSSGMKASNLVGAMACDELCAG